jgi:hypothetical protein
MTTRPIVHILNMDENEPERDREEPPDPSGKPAGPRDPED